MAKLREGDQIWILATVTEVAPFDDKQQLMVRFEPKGETDFGWVCPHEYDFKPARTLVKVNDKVWLDRTQSLIGTVLAVLPPANSNPAFAWIKPDGRNDFRTMPVGDLERV